LLSGVDGDGVEIFGSSTLLVRAEYVMISMIQPLHIFERCELRRPCHERERGALITLRPLRRGMDGATNLL
jgi:hypothetical protein